MLAATGAALGMMLANAAAAAPPLVIERIEPPDWWVGMREPGLQLLVHGAGVARAAVRTDDSGVAVVRATPGDSPNYLFVDLAIAPTRAPGPLHLHLATPDGASDLRYELRARRGGSAEREGFGNRDVIFNLMPDRFANGDPSNDSLAGYADRADRSAGSGRHGGDIAGIAAHLDDLARLGITVIWPTPLLENNQPAYSYHGYAATDTYRIDPRFGSLADYVDLSRQARARGMCLIQDIVLNHVGSHHWWMRDLPFGDWLTHEGTFAPTNHARTTSIDPYAAQVDKDSFTRGWFIPDMPDMNQRNPFVATYQIQNTLWWIETADLCGLRIDTFGYSDHDFLERWSRRVRAEYPRLNIVGEEWSENPLVVARWLDGARGYPLPPSHLPSGMDFPLREALVRALTERETLHSGLQGLYEAMANDLVYPKPSQLVLFEGNHDVSRLFSAVDEDEALWRMAMTFVLTAPRIPQLYYGSDLLMTSPKERNDPEFRRDYPGGWTGDAVNGFTGAGLTEQQHRAGRFLRTLLHWRKAAVAAHAGGMLHYAPQEGTYVFFRTHARQRLMVVLAKNAGPVRLATAHYRQGLGGAHRGRDVATGVTVDFSGDEFVVPPRRALILELE